ncbi:MAG: hypothetical protein R2941_11060 [Desulfobacterales bacterium]
MAPAKLSHSQYLGMVELRRTVDSAVTHLSATCALAPQMIRLS